MNSNKVYAEPVSPHMRISSKQQVDEIYSAAKENEIDQRTWYDYCYSFHRQYWTTNGINSKLYDLIIARTLSILIWFYTIIIEFLVYRKIISSLSSFSFSTF